MAIDLYQNNFIIRLRFRHSNLELVIYLLNRSWKWGHKTPDSASTYLISRFLLMIAQTIELPTITVMSSIEKIVVRIMAITVDSIMMEGVSLSSVTWETETRNLWFTPVAHTRSRQHWVTENVRSKPIVSFHKNNRRASSITVMHLLLKLWIRNDPLAIKNVIFPRISSIYFVYVSQTDLTLA